MNTTSICICKPKPLWINAKSNNARFLTRVSRIRASSQAIGLKINSEMIHTTQWAETFPQTGNWNSTSTLKLKFGLILEAKPWRAWKYYPERGVGVCFEVKIRPQHWSRNVTSDMMLKTGERFNPKLLKTWDQFSTNLVWKKNGSDSASKFNLAGTYSIYCSFQFHIKIIFSLSNL